MSDLIEEYLKETLAEHGLVEIQRREIATRFDCVPSQINYVINTRFTLHHGYQVESKRGGGGYIRISEVKTSDQADFISELLDLIDSKLTQADARSMVETLYDREIVSEREARLLLVGTKPLTDQSDMNDRLRALLFKQMLRQLLYENEHPEKGGRH